VVLKLFFFYYRVGTCHRDQEKVGMTKSTFINMKSILQSKQITNKLKMRIINCYVYSTLIFGAESWTLNKLMVDKINASEMWIYRQIGYTLWKEKKTRNLC
jgi:hypothetical protein